MITWYKNFKIKLLKLEKVMNFVNKKLNLKFFMWNLKLLIIYNDPLIILIMM